ncbi:MAG: sulfotransferase domain-containing protein [Cyanobacteriota bacterium]|nr:sulfotransferase domain-containing protein [Cyanobacteriota bacterium]
MKNLIRKTYNKFLENYQISKLAIISLYQGWMNRHLFQDCEKYCMFIGYPRSGHSLVGTLLDAHPNIIIAHELDALKYIKAGFSSLQMYYLLLKNSQYFISKTLEIPVARFKWIVPNQWNGKFTNLKVIGDKKGDGSTRILKNNFELLQTLSSAINIPIKIIHVIRNPFDNISTMYNKSPSRSLEVCIDRYFDLCHTNESIMKLIDSNNIFLLKLESLIAYPKKEIEEMIKSFLGIEVDNQYLEDCSSLIFDSPNKTRNKTPWNEELIELTQKKIDQVSFLKGYNFYN